MKLVRYALLALVTSGAILVPGAAYADSAITSDTKGDVLVYDFSADATSDAPMKDPSVSTGDIVSSAVSYGPRRITMAMHYRDLAMTGDGFQSAFRVRTNEGRVRTLLLYAGPGHWSGATRFVKGRDTTARCRGVRHNIYYTSNLMRVSIPNRCLSRPRWIEAGMRTVEAIDELHYYADDANADGHFYDEPVWGTRVYR